MIRCKSYDISRVNIFQTKITGMRVEFIEK